MTEEKEAGMTGLWVWWFPSAMGRLGSPVCQAGQERREAQGRFANRPCGESGAPFDRLRRADEGAVEGSGMDSRLRAGMTEEKEAGMTGLWVWWFPSALIRDG